MKRICVFCSSSNALKEEYYNDAKEMGKLIGQAGFDFVYGGSTLGLMGTCAAAAKENGSKVTGVMPKRLCDFGISSGDCDMFYMTDGMRERKAKLDKLSDGIIALPGGFGTLEEISEMIVQKQLGYNNKPIVFLNTLGFYDKLINFFDLVIENNFAKKILRETYFVAKTPQEAIDYILNYKPENTPSKFEDIYVEKK